MAFDYVFLLDGRECSVGSEDVAFCYPSICEEGNYFFTLNNGQRFRATEVKEVRRIALALIRVEMTPQSLR